MGNTCYMNASLQCLSNTVPLVNYIIDSGIKLYQSDLNPTNTLASHKNHVFNNFAMCLNEMHNKKKSNQGINFFEPTQIKKSIEAQNQLFKGSA